MPQARPVMFCSATPALTNCSGKRPAKPSRTPKPRSPVIRVMRSSASARSFSAAMKASRTGGLQLRDGGLIFGALRRPIVPEHGVLHEGNALPLDGMAEHHGGPAPLPGRDIERRGEREMVVPVDLLHVPVEGPPLVGERLELQRVRYRGERLDLVVIDGDDEVVEPMMG